MAETVETKPKEEDVSGAGSAVDQKSGRPRLRWVLLGAGLVVAVFVVVVWQYYAVRESTDDAQIEGHIHPISARVSGTVIKVEVNNNQSVDAGQVMVALDPRDYQVALQRAQADLAQAEADWKASQVQISVTSDTTASRLSNTAGGVSEAQASLLYAQKQAEAAQARLAAAQARLQEAQANSTKGARDLERMKQLIAKEEISQQQYDSAVATADSLSATVTAAQASVTDAQADVQASQSGIARERAKLAQADSELQAARTAPQQLSIARARAEAARAKWDQAKAAVAQAQLNLEYTTIQAPIGGIVSKKNVEVGQLVQAGQPLLALIPLEDIWVTANFKETQLRDMHPGQKATISVDAYGGRKYDGHVDSIAAATGASFSLLPPENAAGNYVKVVQRVPVKIFFEKGQNPEHLLRPGMSVVPTVLIR
jgi:membrane fusion protein, multidrug efflux system